MSDLRQLQARGLRDSRAWFPAIHADHWSATVHFTLGLIGEAGEIANLVKKANRNPAERGAAWESAIAHEIADVAIYLFDLAGELGIDVALAIEAKRAILIERWGDPDA